MTSPHFPAGAPATGPKIETRHTATGKASPRSYRAPRALSLPGDLASLRATSATRQRPAGPSGLCAALRCATSELPGARAPHDGAACSPGTTGPRRRVAQRPEPTTSTTQAASQMIFCPNGVSENSHWTAVEKTRRPRAQAATALRQCASLRSQPTGRVETRHSYAGQCLCHDNAAWRRGIETPRRVDRQAALSGSLASPAGLRSFSGLEPTLPASRQQLLPHSTVPELPPCATSPANAAQLGHAASLGQGYPHAPPAARTPPRPHADQPSRLAPMPGSRADAPQASNVAALSWPSRGDVQRDPMPGNQGSDAYTGEVPARVSDGQSQTSEDRLDTFAVSTRGQRETTRPASYAGPKSTEAQATQLGTTPDDPLDATRHRLSRTIVHDWHSQTTTLQLSLSRVPVSRSVPVSSAGRFADSRRGIGMTIAGLSTKTQFCIV